MSSDMRATAEIKKYAVVGFPESLLSGILAVVEYRYSMYYT